MPWEVSVLESPTGPGQCGNDCEAQNAVSGRVLKNGDHWGPFIQYTWQGYYSVSCPQCPEKNCFNFQFSFNASMCVRTRVCFVHPRCVLMSTPIYVDVVAENDGRHLSLLLP